jgi:hypothetical protein
VIDQPGRVRRCPGGDGERAAVGQLGDGGDDDDIERVGGRWAGDLGVVQSGRVRAGVPADLREQSAGDAPGAVLVYGAAPGDVGLDVVGQQVGP